MEGWDDSKSHFLCLSCKRFILQRFFFTINSEVDVTICWKSSKHEKKIVIYDFITKHDIRLSNLGDSFHQYFDYWQKKRFFAAEMNNSKKNFFFLCSSTNVLQKTLLSSLPSILPRWRLNSFFTFKYFQLLF